MKTNNPNVFFNHQTNLLFEKTSQIMKQKLLFTLMLVSIYSSVFAQVAKAGKNGTIVLTELNSLLASGKTSGSALPSHSSADKIDLQRLNDLVSQVKPSIYFYQGEIKSYGDYPTNLYTDASSLGQLNSTISEKQNIEIVTIRINTASRLSTAIDLSFFSNFPNLKYIYILSNVETTESVIAGLIRNNEERFTIFYKIDKGS
jgi:hypothetical protein